MKEKSLMTIAQNKESALIWGMPGKAIKVHAACKVLAPEAIAEYLIKQFA